MDPSPFKLFKQPIVVNDNTKFLNTRSVNLKPFVDRLDRDRKRAGYKPYGPEEIARCMSHIATDDLPYFYEQLDKAKSKETGEPIFGQLWHWYCKPKKGEAPRPLKDAPWKTKKKLA